MSTYTTGEMAKLCEVTVRTVQYYDTRGILTPSELTEGGRRLYSEDDVKKMKIICFLRQIGLSIDVIGQLFQEDDPGSVIGVLLSQQEALLREELNEKQAQLEKLEGLQKEIQRADHFSVESIRDVACTMENKKKMTAMHRNLLLIGIPMTLAEWGTALLWIFRGIWWPFALQAVIVIPLAVWMSRYYFKNTAYICPQCHEVFKPSGKEAFFAPHTPTTRKLTCSHCGHKGYCVETWGGK